VDLLDRRGHEQQGRRPCVVVGEANGLVVAIPLTSTTHF
jgi:mRNA-degrading endonuclease toxin of MazEF toxin-antitoxin module